MLIVIILQYLIAVPMPMMSCISSQHFGTGSPVKGAGNGLTDYLPVSPLCHLLPLFVRRWESVLPSIMPPSASVCEVLGKCSSSLCPLCHLLPLFVRCWESILPSIMPPSASVCEALGKYSSFHYATFCLCL